MNRQDRQGVRTAPELERKYNIQRIKKTAEKASAEILKLAESYQVSGENEKGFLVGSLRPGILQIAQWGVPYPGAEDGILSQVQIIESSIAFTESVYGKTLELKLEDGKGRLSGLTAPEGDTDAVNKAYLEEFVFRELDKLRAELSLPVG